MAQQAQAQAQAPAPGPAQPQGNNDGVLAAIRAMNYQLSNQNVTSCISKFAGEEKKFKTWTKEIEKYAILINDNGDQRKNMLAFQSAEGPVSDFIHRFATNHPNSTWVQMKAELKTRFGGISDESQYLALLQRAKQGKTETVQVFGERLLEIASEAYPGQDLANPIISRQLVSCFIDGLRDTAIARKIIRDNPADFPTAVRTATAEQNVLLKFDVRLGAKEMKERREIVPMEIGHVQAKQVQCFSCKQFGHIKRNCKNKQRRDKSGIECWNCHEMGHYKSECRKVLQ